MKEFVITVDPNDQAIGTAEKMEAHEKALLHRAFSVFVFNINNELLLHQRAISKYHSGGKWTNTCCGHPRPGENTTKAAQRRLDEEMGIQCILQHRFTFTYRAELDNGLTEHEIDHVFFGLFDGTPQPDPSEVMNHRWVTLEIIAQEIKNHPEQFTEWFKICLNEVMNQQK